METHSRIIISLGGSLMYPNVRDEEYISRFAQLLKSKPYAFAIITGGGHLARQRQEELKRTHPEVTPQMLDEIGIEATRDNAHYLRDVLDDVAEEGIFIDPTDVQLSGQKVLVGGGWKPGHSSDASAVALAKTLGAKKLINLSNIDYVYTADPRTNPGALPIEKISWAEFRKMLPEKWEPGLNAPFDPVAAQMAEELGMEVVVMNGKNLENLSHYLDNLQFQGTVIS